jgi:hypothetical protein
MSITQANSTHSASYTWDGPDHLCQHSYTKHARHGANAGARMSFSLPPKIGQHEAMENAE